MDVSLPIRFYEGDRVQGNQHDTLPRYYVYGGLVFTPITLDYLKTFGRNWSDTAGSELLYELYYHKLEKPATARTEPIILASTLPAAANANLRINHKALVSRINGIKIDKLEDVIRAFEQNKEAQHTIEFQPNNAIECLERAEVDKANPQILKTYGITKDRRL